MNAPINTSPNNETFTQLNNNAMSKKSEQKYQYFAIYKPYGYLSQFTDEGKYLGLKNLYSFLPDTVYPVGRLDADSEGLLLITNDNSLKHQLLEPKYEHTREYFVQVEGIPSEDALQSLRNGVDIRVNQKTYRTLPATVELIAAPDFLPQRNPPIRYRAQIPTAWLRLVLHEGKNRQVRRMTAQVGFPTLRLVRTAIGQLKLGKCEAGDIWELSRKEVYQQALEA
jgi:23S rRNA pseudouridine2457 synthase